MELNDIERFKEIDTNDMYGQISRLPSQLKQAWRMSLTLPLPFTGNIKNILIVGMGGSAIGGDLLKEYVQPYVRIPIVVHRDYYLPAWASDDNTLVIVASHSGNTEETLIAFNEALQNHCRILAISTGGRLAQDAQAENVPVWTFEHEGQPRAAVGFSFGLLLGLLVRLGLLEEQNPGIDQAVEAMLKQQDSLKADVPVNRNPAKRLAGQLVGRWVTVIGSGALAPVARRWKTQINEIAKCWSQFEILPEFDHNGILGTQNPAELLTNAMVLFLRAPSDHPRNRLRSDLTRQSLLVEGLNTDFIDAVGIDTLSHIWTCLHFGDYVAYYLAMAYGVDPTAIPAIEHLKTALKSH